MISAVIGALIIGLLGIFAIVIGQGIAGGQSTAGWPVVLVTIMNNITPIIGIVAIVAMFLIVVKVAGGFGAT
jgi:hypothetical protein